jgi:hypothetical protein
MPQGAAPCGELPDGEGDAAGGARRFDG